MKKKLLSLLVVGLIFAFNMNAQKTAPAQYPKANFKKNLPVTFSQSKINKPSPVKSGKMLAGSCKSRWYNYGETMNLWHQINVGDTSQLTGNNLFPDSTILVDYAGTFGPPWIHSLGDVLDVSSSVFNDINIYPNENLFMTDAIGYTVDSIGFLFYYNRNMSDTTIVDTLLFEVDVVDTANWWFFAGGSVNTNLGVDTVSWIGMPYDYTTNTLSSNTKVIFKIPLTQQTYADSLANGFHYIEFPTAGLPTALPGQVAMTSVTFIPGYIWIANMDTLDKKNSIFFLTYNESPGNFLTYTKWDFNVSYIADIYVRYNNAGGWNGYYLPSFAYNWQTTPTFYYEHHLIYYKVTEVVAAPVADFSTSGNPMVSFTDMSVGGCVDSWLWDFGDGTTDTTQNPTHTFNKDTTYNVCLTVTNGSGSDSTCKMITIMTGLDEREFEKSINIYPNPTSDKFIIDSEIKSTNTDVEVLNLVGQIVASYKLNSMKEKSIDLSSHPNGIYFVRIKTSEGIATKKIILSR